VIEVNRLVKICYRRSSTRKKFVNNSSSIRSFSIMASTQRRRRRWTSRVGRIVIRFIPGQAFADMQSVPLLSSAVQNTASRAAATTVTVFNLWECYRLPVHQKVTYKMAMNVYKCFLSQVYTKDTLRSRIDLSTSFWSHSTEMSRILPTKWAQYYTRPSV